MNVVEKLRQIALSLPEVAEYPHFEKTSFRVYKKIFATAVPEHSRATIKLSPAEQDIFCTFDSTVIYPVPNKWGKQGWAHINLQAIKEEILTGILKAAYCEIAPRHLAALVSFE
ncbi:MULTISPECIES: MmcQ/YjbR family DNA-binding protein [unclassified Mucilaginibacter]|uniref:MmcQ/YjbR family DNA-binding protein n=1 Tax=unclassified Mucilaginibacter TaxID=2617802 RepID=UPI002AC96FA5|nr:MULTISPECIES: MmcQ/YjbR family DNA-binding protein [unclassified Mucilaginibacter]MEB0260236.1 MmcQ/YjbR family DNA-binding protein [Mucilaginibacter sp. 10I4]MEB0277353.1 MmcQ/YjbR family DNA-binding protein [Mucilaginibacter sp. 10B2]MEB0300165.1 MmcQ/YjbR family DNA-binding protein [Mucilaginibacter sp. 5C4]WPX25477.1 MmcQ/YjbR family DNA-binding protein [Mucilaginibacter sp. 5C4]